ncbi:hypothetical protein P7C70_g2542, partial [Phenoliferia sp. Uapishka_3]
MGVLDEVLGALAVGSWVNSILYAYEISQAYYYFSTFKNDSSIAWLMVSFAILMDTIGTMSYCALVYLYTVSHFGDELFLVTQNWTFPTLVAANGISVITLHTFLVIRVYRLSKQWTLAAALYLVALCALAGDFWSTANLVRFPQYAQRDELTTPLTFWDSSSAGADILIAFTLMYLIRKSRMKVSGFNQSAMAKPLKLLYFAALESGAVPSAVTLIGLGLYLWNKSSNIGPSLYACIGRVSSITLLYNLNLRKATADSLMHSDGALESASKSNGPSGLFKSWRKGARSANQFEMNVAVSTVTDVRHEGDEDFRIVTLPSSSTAHSALDIEKNPDERKLDRVTFDEDHSV